MNTFIFILFVCLYALVCVNALRFFIKKHMILSFILYLFTSIVISLFLPFIGILSNTKLILFWNNLCGSAENAINLSQMLFFGIVLFIVLSTIIFIDTTIKFTRIILKDHKYIIINPNDNYLLNTIKYIYQSFIDRYIGYKIGRILC